MSIDWECQKQEWEMKMEETEDECEGVEGGWRVNSNKQNN